MIEYKIEAKAGLRLSAYAFKRTVAICQRKTVLSPS